MLTNHKASNIGNIAEKIPDDLDIFPALLLRDAQKSFQIACPIYPRHALQLPLALSQILLARNAWNETRLLSLLPYPTPY